MSSTRPFVSVVTPTYNRGRFIAASVACYKAQTYPKDRMEWIVLDDGTEKIENEFLELTKDLPNIRYISLAEKVNIGEKRNRLNQEARGDIIVCWDDDDYYYPERVAHAVVKLEGNTKYEVAGSSEMYMGFTDDGTIVRLGPYTPIFGPNHATNGTMAYRKSFAKTHFYDETVTFSEEASFLQKYKVPLVQLDPKKVMFVIAHSENTYGKDKLKQESPFVKRLNLKFKDFIKDKQLCSFYSQA